MVTTSWQLQQATTRRPSVDRVFFGASLLSGATLLRRC
jgi:hypothetical protein